LNGEKCFIANAPVGKLFFIDARSNPNAPLRVGTTMFLVPRDTPGFRIGKVFNKSGWRFYRNGEMIFENARVPHANIVGEVNGAVRRAAAAAATAPAATSSAILNWPRTRSASATTPASRR
jgi:acyl-CoA dehydrogenase